MPNTSNAQQIKGIIENSGIKQDEIKWIGLDDYLKKHSLEKINKQQLQDYIKANQINLVCPIFLFFSMNSNITKKFLLLCIYLISST